MALQLLYGQAQTPTIPKKDLTGQTIIVTGANAGLGLDAAKHLYRLNCSHIILACRDNTKGERAKEDIIQTSTAKHPNTTISVWHLDMSSYISVREFAHRASTLSRLDSAILNAGVSLTEFTLAESLESTLTVNVTATFLLAILLLPTLQQTSVQTSTSTHLTVVGSQIHHFAKQDQLTHAAKSPDGIFASLSDATTAKMPDRYFLSKLLVTLLTDELAAQVTRSRNANVIVNSVNPGYCRTSLFRHDETAVSRLALRVIGRSSEEGSRSLVYAIADAGPETHGGYVSECQVKQTSSFVRSKEGKKMGKMLWKEVVEISEMVQPGCIEKFGGSKI